MFDFDDDIRFTSYQSDFNSDIDLDFQTEDHTYSSEWDFPESLQGRILDRAREWGSRLKRDFNTALKIGAGNGTIYAIISVTGDDEIITTDNVTIILLHLSTAEIISEITISGKDTGISGKKGNYTEGWILHGPAREADFTSVILRHHRDGVPLVFDITKLKATSAVRKQSSLELDLESKYSLLNKAADWVDKNWFTYDFAQMSLIFATCIFDFTAARIFPYLYKTEGGCGGKPPWNCVPTALCTLRYFNKGKSTKSVLALMDECYQISEFNIEPHEALYINASHYAQAGNEKLSQISNAKRFLQSFDKETRMEVLESCRGADALPPELLEKSVVVEVKDKLLGCAISELRKNGLILTELDVQLKQIGLEKFSDLLKNENMGTVRKRREEEKKRVKRNGLAQLSRFSNVDITLTNIEESALSIMSRYYYIRTDLSDMTSLIYAGLLRVFKTSDVDDYYRRHSFGLSDEIITGISMLKNQNLNLKTNQAKTDLVYQIDWLETGELYDLFEDEIPPSIGSDDARLGRKILKSIEIHRDMDTILVFVIISNDVRLEKSINKLVSHYGNVRIVRYGLLPYILECHTNISMAKVEAYNFLRNSTSRFDGIEKQIRQSVRWIGGDRVSYKILYDFPNINKELMGFFPISKGLIGKTIGGFLRRETARASGYQLLAWNDFKSLPDFEKSVKKFTA
mmetsp:Transcript_4340/g.9047  ORF Transcript_4340/g.9047 Transcript_4340/m.9047 type:complete len:688 (-) Transcript_4340:67-2130(-)|eukprot:CAMPEP_0113398046 /NCGR_PEP_ID=MMETSP0013_2-20120614/14727_1 /TAXON_ID=2843 ORGANISM="Skeletonema costatum, Strain 1716" /NCGR_SAMPLE_ID=MMETSP0013_2 /ASSEMBLY_ACC=CAM_ASM_000158 /LENGTH=687 /DNA_ID=CAMNT_0000282715 /DNA_START=35 /DNA_END=2098 /DNA_ORIENTATION=- /assembly_acc=CAM_ASM_000158